MYAIRSYYELSDVGFIISGWGFGGAIGMIIMPSLSDRLGRKPVVFVCSAIYGARITSYNVCYTKLLRRPKPKMPANANSENI